MLQYRIEMKPSFKTRPDPMKGNPNIMPQRRNNLQEEVMMRTSECYDLCLSIEEKLEQAHKLYSVWGERLKGEPRIAELLGKLDAYIDASWQAMFDLDVVETCKYCDEQEGGSCCGAGIENKYDPILLLMNLLLDAPLPDAREEEGDCFFLGPTGCKLKVRLVLCVDYLCPKLQRKLAPEKLHKLQSVSGDELLTGFILYDTIKTFLMRQNHAH